MSEDWSVLSHRVCKVTGRYVLLSKGKPVSVKIRFAFHSGIDEIVLVN